LVAVSDVEGVTNRAAMGWMIVFIKDAVGEAA